jgi:hypothetical protein
MYSTVKAFVNWLCDGTLRVIWLKLTELAIVAAFLIWLMVYVLDHSAHPLDQFGHLWMVGGGLVCYLVMAGLTVWARSLPSSSEEEAEAICPGCGHPVRRHPHVDPDLAELACNTWYEEAVEP